MTASDPTQVQLNPSLLLGDGTIGYSAAGDVLDASGFDTILKARGGTNTIHFKAGSNEVASFSPNGLGIQTGNASAPSVITVGVSLGVKNNAGTKLMEVKSSGNLTIAGSSFSTTPSSPSLSGSASFDSFDFAEVYPFDVVYPDGTVVCPGPDDKLTLCRHSNCQAAMVITPAPGFSIGEKDEENCILPVALVGRVKVRTDQDIPRGSLVVSNGRGGVRKLVAWEWGYTLGFTLNEPVDGMVGIHLRPQFVIQKPN